VRYGADPAAWARYQALGLTADLLPVVSNPNATVSPRSTLKALGKTPSRYNQDRHAVGIAEWTRHRTSAAEIERWAKEPDFGICVQTRRLRAIDVDVEDSKHSKAAMLAMRAFLGETPMVRARKTSGKCLIPFWFIDGPLAKHVLPVEGGMIEILADGQQFIAEGRHPKGERYEWLGEEIPVLDADDFAALLDVLKAIATGPIRVARSRRDLNGAKPLHLQDDVAEWLVDNWEIYDVGQEGQVFIACPFADEHSAESGVTSCAYFPAGTGGYAEGNFVCLHAHCTGRDQAEFLNACGFVAGQFDIVPANEACVYDRTKSKSSGVGRADGATGEAVGQSIQQLQIIEERRPRLKRDKNGILPTMDNLVTALAAPVMIERHLALDMFRDEIVWAPAREDRGEAQWRPFRDSDYARVRQALEQRGFKPFGAEMLRLAILTVAEDQAIDSAKSWLDRLRWDGVQRLDDFAIRAWDWADNPYSRAVGRYVWTALAGRVLAPGCQADMAVALIGEQGIRKTTAIKAMAPDPDFYLSVKLSAHDDDTSRKLRGKLIAELEELRGLNSVAIEEIKAWITRTHEEWIPKWREFATRFARRNVFIASSNEVEFLADPTGERRWLPGLCGAIDVDWIVANRDQLWAEGAVLFTLDGVDWQDAERLATSQHKDFKISDAWAPYVQRWLEEDQVRGPPVEWPWVTTGDALTGAIGLPVHAIDLRRQQKMARVLAGLGFKAKRIRDGEALVNAFVREKENG